MQGENAATERSLLEMARDFDPNSGVALVCAFENQNLLARTSMQGKEVLEVGCGCLPASFGVSDDRMPPKYVATDISDALVEAARKVDQRPLYRIESAVAFSFQPRTFDLIIMRCVLHHLCDPAAALKGLRSLLKPGGQLLIYEPNLSSLPGNLAKWVLWNLFRIRMEESPYGQLSHRSIHQAIVQADFQLRDVWYSSLLAYPLTGDYGRRPVLPNRVGLFRAVIAVDRSVSALLHVAPGLAKRCHHRVVFLLEAFD
jgi:SAM-dependent methyltransferase